MSFPHDTEIVALPFFFFFGIRYNCCCLFVTMQMVAIYLRNIYNFVDRII